MKLHPWWPSVRLPRATKATTLPVVLFVFVPSVSHGQCELAKVVASDGAAGDRFSDGLAISGQHALVGSPLHDEVGADSGAAYVFDLLTHQEVRKLVASDGAAGDVLGGYDSCALSGPWAIVGARGDDDLGVNSGSAYVFDVQTGQELRKLTASDGTVDDEFGKSVAAAGNYVVVAAWQANPGAAYIFDLTTGQERAKLVAGDGASGDQFGYTAAIAGKLALVGAHRDDADRGSAYVFDIHTGQQLFKLTASDGDAGDLFGASVAMTESLALVGAHLADGPVVSSGAAYIFDLTTGQEIVKLTAGDAAEGDRFGLQVGIHGERALIGARWDDDLGSISGAAYVFDVATWQELWKLTASDGSPGDQLGESLAVHGSIAIIGAESDGNATGSAYFFDVSGADCNTNGIPDCEDIQAGTSAAVDGNGIPDECELLGTNYCTANQNSTGLPASIAAFGSEVIADNNVTLVTADVAVDQFGYYLMSDQQGFIPLFGGSQGNLCLGSPIVRFAENVLFSGSAGEMIFTPDLTALPQNTVFMPGETWNFQCWFRDVVGANFTSNTSDGLSITWQ